MSEAWTGGTGFFGSSSSGGGLAAALAEVAPSPVAFSAPEPWRGQVQLALDPGETLALDVQMYEDWLVLTAPGPLASRDCRAGAWLEQAGGLSREVGLAIPPGDVAPGLRADLFVGSGSLDDTARSRLRGLFDEFVSAAGCMSREDAPEPGAVATSDLDPGALDEAALPVLAERLARAGWPGTERSNGSFNVDLDVGDRFAQANVASYADGWTRACVALPQPQAGACSDAVALLLLRCSGWVRLARAALGPLGAPQLGVALPEAAREAELAHALGALSVAMRAVGEEAALLARDETLARRFNVLGGAASGAARRVFNHSEKGKEKEE